MWGAPLPARERQRRVPARRHVRVDDGRVVRPLLTVPEGGGWRWCPNLEADIDALLERGALRYVDAAEVAAADVVLSPSSVRSAGSRANLLEVHAYPMKRAIPEKRSTAAVFGQQT